MPNNNKTGLKGEHAAANFLKSKGYDVIHQNWRHGKKEVDIIACTGDIVIFAEVKTRTSSKLQFPEEAVTKAKQNHLKTAGEAFINMYPQYRNIRYDIISVMTEGDHVREIVHFEEAFY